MNNFGSILLIFILSLVIFASGCTTDTTDTNSTNQSNNNTTVTTSTEHFNNSFYEFDYPSNLIVTQQSASYIIHNNNNISYVVLQGMPYPSAWPDFDSYVNALYPNNEKIEATVDGKTAYTILIGSYNETVVDMGDGLLIIRPNYDSGQDKIVDNAYQVVVNSLQIK